MGVVPMTTPQDRADDESRLAAILARLDDPKLGNPKYAMDRRAVEGELRAFARQALSLLTERTAELFRAKEALGLDDPLPAVRFPLALEDGRVWQNDGDALDDAGIAALNALAAALAPDR